MSTNLEDRRNQALRELQEQGGWWAYTYSWVVNPRRNDRDYLGISPEALVRNQDRSMTADEAAEYGEVTF